MPQIAPGVPRTGDALQQGARSVRSVRGSLRPRRRRNEHCPIVGITAGSTLNGTRAATERNAARYVKRSTGSYPRRVPMDTGSFLAHRPPKFFREIIEIADDSSGSAQHGSRVKWPAASAYSSSERTASLSGGERPADALQRLALRRDAEARRD